MSEQIVAVGPLLPDNLAQAMREAFRTGDNSSLVEQLARLTEIQVSGLVVYGSMGDRSLPAEIGSSDVDLLLLTDSPANGGVFGFTQDIQVDLHVQMRDSTLNDPATNWIYADGRVLWDAREPELEKWLEFLRLWKHAHIERWTEADRLRSRVWAYRLVTRVEHLAQIDPAQAKLHESRLIAAFPGFHARLCERHTTSMSKWWRALPTSDPEFSEILEAYLSSVGPTLDPKLLYKVVELLFSSDERRYSN